MTAKSEIGKVFRKLEKFGYLVKSFGDNRKLRQGAVGFVDLCLFNRENLYFIEIKTKSTKDKLNEKQKQTGEFLNNIAEHNIFVHYFIIKDLAEAKKLQENILFKDKFESDYKTKNKEVKL